MTSGRSPVALVRSYLEEVVAQGRLELVEELALPDMVDEANQAFGGPPGRAGLVAHVRGFRRHLDGPRIEIRRIVGGPQSAMAWWAFTGTHAGPWLGRPPTGRPVRGDVFSFFDLADGRIARYRLFMVAEFPERVILDTSRPGAGLAGGGPRRR